MFGTSSFKSRSNSLEPLVRTAILNSELAPGVAARIQQYRKSQLTCEEQRLLAILDDAVADGCVVPIELSAARGRYSPALGVK
ncbi:MAG: hypothetical protein WBB01_24475 [Phormidesmis sp.]